MTVALELAMIIVPVVAIVRLRQAALQGLGHVARGQLPETVVQPGLLLLLLASLFALPDLPRTGPMAVGLYALAACIACAVGMHLLRGALPRELGAATPAYHTRLWLSRAVPFVWILGMNVLIMHMDVVMLGLMDGPDAAGIYRAANQMAALVAFPLTAVNMAFAPVIARLYERGERSELQRRATAAARLIIVMALPVALALALLGKPILTLFGAEFASGSTALAILCGAYLVNAAMGTSGYLLIMTKHEKAAAIAFAVSAGLNLVGNLLLIPPFGIEGAAVATALSIVAVSVAFAWIARRKLGIRPTALAPSSGDA
jgi:O-antigen/teichoic acid export membrane protein